MKILILSSGEHIQGRLILNKLIRNKFSKILLVKEEETKLAKIHDNFLKELNSRVPLFHEMNVDVVKTQKINNSFILKMISKLKPNFIIQGGIGILKKEVLSNGFFLNIHPGMLPGYRGLDPVLWSVYNNDPVGATVHRVDANIDSGPILVSEILPYNYDNKIINLRYQCMEWGAELLLRFLSNPDKYKPKKQDLRYVKYYSLFPKEKIVNLEKKLQKIIALRNT